MIKLTTSTKKYIKELFLIPDDNSKYRDDWVKQAIASIPIDKDEAKTLLDVGAGEQRYKKHCKGFKYISQDFCDYDGIGNKEGLQTDKWNTSSIDIVSDAANIPLKDKAVDVILCTEVLEHLSNPYAVIDEFYRLLKPGGILILTAPFWSLTHFAPYHFSTGFNKYWYYDAFKDKFSVERISTSGNYFYCISFEIYRTIQMRRSHKGNKYTSKRLNFFEMLILFIAVRIFSQLSKNNINSEELLNSGFLISAKKIGNF